MKELKDRAHLMLAQAGMWRKKKEDEEAARNLDILLRGPFVPGSPFLCLGVA